MNAPSNNLRVIRADLISSEHDWRMIFSVAHQSGFSRFRELVLDRQMDVEVADVGTQTIASGDAIKSE